MEGYDEDYNDDEAEPFSPEWWDDHAGEEV
jgi:hypothetical protein